MKLIKRYFWLVMAIAFVFLPFFIHSEFGYNAWFFAPTTIVSVVMAIYCIVQVINTHEPE